MKISVIIPIYNGEKYVAECIENILRQTHGDLEIIVVDDGSTDCSIEIAEKYPVKIIRLEQNRGPAAARNAGMDAASGKYIHFMDVDDTINNEFYEKMAIAVEETNAEIACCGMINEPKPHRTIIFKESLELISIKEKLKVTNVGRWGYTVRYLFNVDFLKAHNLRFEDGRLIEDLPFSFSAVYFANKLVTVPNAIYTYIRRTDSIMTKRDKIHYKKKHKDLRHAKEFRHHFARKHGFKIPGVPTAMGILSLLYVKWLT
jgi:glycosyltransferase involved in cell wall biosynthesis